MSNPPVPPVPPPGTPPPAERTDVGEPNTQGKPPKRNLPEWIQDLPKLRFKPDEPDERAPLIDMQQLEAALEGMDADALKRITDDIRFLDYELLRLFRQRDHAAKKHQNRYRLYQLTYLMLATLATLIGSFQALALISSPGIMPAWAFLETCVALVAVFLATISGRDSPLPLWLMHRRRAEQLRREYFRYITNLPPYDTVEGYKRSMLLSRRAAEINKGQVPEEPSL